MPFRQAHRLTDAHRLTVDLRDGQRVVLRIAVVGARIKAHPAVFRARDQIVQRLRRSVVANHQMHGTHVALAAVAHRVGEINHPTKPGGRIKQEGAVGVQLNRAHQLALSVLQGQRDTDRHRLTVDRRDRQQFAVDIHVVGQHRNRHRTAEGRRRRVVNRHRRIVLSQHRQCQRRRRAQPGSVAHRVGEGVCLTFSIIESLRRRIRNVGVAAVCVQGQGAVGTRQGLPHRADRRPEGDPGNAQAVTVRVAVHPTRLTAARHHAVRLTDRQNTVFVRAANVGLRDRRTVGDRTNRNRHSRFGRQAAGVAHRVAKTRRAADAARRGKGHKTPRTHRHAAGNAADAAINRQRHTCRHRLPIDRRHRQHITVYIAVVRQHGHRHRVANRRRRPVIHRDRRVIDRRHINMNLRIDRRRPVAHRVAEVHRALVLSVRNKAQRAVGVQRHLPLCQADRLPWRYRLPGNRRDRQRVTLRIAVVGQHRNRHRRVFRRAHPVIDRRRTVVARNHVQVELPVNPRRPVAYRVGDRWNCPVKAGRRRERVAAVDTQRQRAYRLTRRTPQRRRRPRRVALQRAVAVAVYPVTADRQ